MSNRKKNLKKVRNSALIKNPLLFEAIGLCPVAAVALSLKSSLFLALLTALEMIICEVLASFLLKNVRRWLRVALYMIFGIVTVFPIMHFTKYFVPSIFVDFGIFLPLLAVNSLIALHCERVAVKATVKNSLIDAVSASLSYGAVAVIVGILREILGSGTIGGKEINMPIKFSIFLLPFGGLVIMGFLAAALKAFVSYKYPNASPDKAFDTSEIRRSLRGSLKSLMNDDFNPYGDEADADSRTGRKTNKKAKPEKKKKEKSPPKPKKAKKEKAEKAKKEKPAKISAEKAVTSRTPRNPENEHTYLDDFSEMLSELEEYKNKNDGGDGE